MQLDQFLENHNVTADQFALEIGASHRATIYRWINGTRIPSPVFMQRIVESTGGKVQPQDFYERLIDG
jgi:hypothetical protein